MKEILERLTANGFPFTGDIIHLFVGGSGLHGAQLDTGDKDYYGVFVEPKEYVIGLKEYPHYVWSTAGDQAKNQPGDTDITLYSLRKWVRLALSGNPTALAFLFAQNLIGPGVGEWGRWILSRNIFAAKESLSAFEGFARQQRDRMFGLRGRGKHGQRPTLENEFGYDPKAAMHVARLLGEGIEFLETGKITYPRPNKEYLKDIRSGKFSASTIEEIFEHLFEKLKLAQEQSKLPQKPNTEKANRLLVESYLDHWALGF